MNETGLASLEADLAWLDGVIADSKTSDATHAVAVRARATMASALTALGPGIIPAGGEADAGSRADETPDDNSD